MAPLRLLDPGYYLEQIPIVVNYAQTTAIGLASVGLSALVSLLPANKQSGCPSRTCCEKADAYSYQFSEAYGTVFRVRPVEEKMAEDLEHVRPRSW